MPDHNDKKPIDWKLSVSFVALLVAILAFLYGSGQCYQKTHPSWIIPFLNLVCPGPTPESTPTPTVTPTPTTSSIKRGKLLFEDNFDDNRYGWLLYPGVWIEGGSLQAFPQGDSGETWLVDTHVDFQDFIYETEVTFIGERDIPNSKIGPTLYFRGSSVSQSSPLSNRFYTFGIHDTKGYQSQRTDRAITPNEWTNLVWKDESLIDPSKKTYKIAVIVEGSRFQLWVDNVFIDSVSDSSYTNGTIGLAFGANTHVAFDYVKVWSLP